LPLRQAGGQRRATARAPYPKPSDPYAWHDRSSQMNFDNYYDQGERMQMK
jgi:hypothetical protein